MSDLPAVSKHCEGWISMSKTAWFMDFFFQAQKQNLYDWTARTDWRLWKWNE